MLIFTFRLHGLIEVTPCGNIAGAMALNRGARPISSFSFCLPTTTSLLLLFLSSFSILFFFAYTVSPAVSLSSTFFPRCFFLYRPSFPPRRLRLIRSLSRVVISLICHTRLCPTEWPRGGTICAQQKSDPPSSSN